MKTRNEAAKQLVSSMKEAKIDMTNNLYSPNIYEHYIGESCASILMTRDYLDTSIDTSYVLTEAFASYTKSLLADSAIGIAGKENHIERMFSFLSVMISAIEQRESLNDLYFALNSLTKEE